VPADIPSDRAVVDRIVDGATAVLLVGPDELELHLPADALPEGATDGTWVILDREMSRPAVLGIDEELTASRAEQLQHRLGRIRQDRAGGRFDR
jgi:hypothetical protein